MPAQTTPRTLDITSLNDAEMDFLMDIAADPAGDHVIEDGCRPKAVRQILAFHGIEVTPVWSMLLNTLRGDYKPGAPSGPDYEGRILAAQERTWSEGDVA